MKNQRAKKDDMLASEERKLDALVVGLLLGRGAVSIPLGQYDYVVDTKFGKMYVSPRGHNIFCRFEDVSRAARFSVEIDGLHSHLFGNSFNRNSGKWNHHYFGRVTAESAFRDFKRMFDGLF